MDKQANYSSDPDVIKKILDNDSKRIDLGWVGKFLGAPKQIASIASLLILLVLTITGVFITLTGTTDSTIKYWETTSSLIALGLGYLFGSR